MIDMMHTLWRRIQLLFYRHIPLLLNLKEKRSYKIPYIRGLFVK
jgi:hypothetical protein